MDEVTVRLTPAQAALLKQLCQGRSGELLNRLHRPSLDARGYWEQKYNDAEATFEVISDALQDWRDRRQARIRRDLGGEPL